MEGREGGKEGGRQTEREREREKFYTQGKRYAFCQLVVLVDVHAPMDCCQVFDPRSMKNALGFMPLQPVCDRAVQRPKPRVQPQLACFLTVQKH